jgi:hypothetical protein
MQNEEIANQKERNSHRQKFITLTHHNKSTQKRAKSIKKLEYNIAYTTNPQKTPHKQNHTQHQT